jgi:hypothetical protein
MPSLRDSGKLVGSSASVRQVAQQCNLSFPLSLRQFISTPGCPFTRCNRLHIKVLTAPTLPLTIEIMLNRMREVYSTAGIGVEVVSRENLTAAVLGNANFNTLNDLDVGACEEGAPSNEQTQLFQNQNNVAAGQRGNEIVVYFVRSVTATAGTDPGTKNGCASHPNGQPGAAVDQSPSQWTLAHEVGHVLGLDHIPGEHCSPTDPPTRLMTGCGTDTISGTPTLSQGEINTMTSSNLTRQC